jgi:hypothetical protein
MVMKLDKDYNVAYFTVLGESYTRTYTMDLDKVNTKAYVVQNMYSSPKYAYGIVKLNDLSGKREWSSHLWHST